MFSSMQMVISFCVFRCWLEKHSVICGLHLVLHQKIEKNLIHTFAFGCFPLLVLKENLNLFLLTVAQQEQIESQQAAAQQQQLIIIQQQQLQQAAAEEETRRLEDERRRVEVKKVAERKTEVKKEVVNKEQVTKKETAKMTKTEAAKKKIVVSSVQPSSYSSSRSLSELLTLRLKLEAAEGSLSQHVHICLGDDGVHDCVLRITQLEVGRQTQKYRMYEIKNVSLKCVMLSTSIHWNNCICVYFL